MVSLPGKFCERMKVLLGEDGFNKYLGSFKEKPVVAIRVNTSKTDLQKWKEICPFDTEEIPWCQNGFIIKNADKTEVSKHPYYFAGLYYIQEPSAMLPASVLPVEKDDKVLDLCAAPGGKAVEIAARLNGTGLLVANDISISRTAALAKNLQVSGASNILITSETPEHLAVHFKEYFDKILLDVPCSGEGMFCRKPGMVNNWLEKGPLYYIRIQKDILSKAYSMLKPGGSLVYSTCTFSVEENEGMIQWFIDTYKDMEICKIPFKEGFSPGRPDMLSYGNRELKKCTRIFPHISKGEGHFATLLKKEEGKEAREEEIQTGNIYIAKSRNNNKITANKNNNNKNLSKDNCNWQEEIKEFVPGSYLESYCLVRHKNTVQLIPKETAGVKLLRVVQNGLIAGEIKKHFEPSCQLALSALSGSYKNRLDIPLSDINVIKYLKGETININAAYKGMVLVTVDGFPLGWGKADGQGRLKNKYNAGWRML